MPDSTPINPLPDKWQQWIAFAEMLVGLGLTTADAIKAFFQNQSDDDALLDQASQQLDAIIARREADSG